MVAPFNLKEKKANDSNYIKKIYKIPIPTIYPIPKSVCNQTNCFGRQEHAQVKICIHKPSTCT